MDRDKRCRANRYDDYRPNTSSLTTHHLVMTFDLHGATPSDLIIQVGSQIRFCWPVGSMTQAAADFVVIPSLCGTQEPTQGG